MPRMLLLLISFISINASHAGGFFVGNGGNVVLCAGMNHYQSLDYVLTNGMYGKNVKVVNARVVDQSLDRIESLLAEKIPSKLESFRIFRSQILNTNNSKRYLWIETVGHLGETSNERIYLPGKCANSLGGTEINQAVVRRVLPGQTIFYYDPAIYEHLESRSPINLSFLLVHEWIWDMTNNSQFNRNINYFFHSNLFEKMTTEEIKIFFKKMNGKNFSFE